MLRKLILLPLLVLLPFSAVFADEQVCASPSAVSVATDEQGAVAKICAAADNALAFLSSFDLKPKGIISIEVVKERIDTHGYAAYGSFHSDNDHIKLMSYATIFATSEHPEMFSEPFDQIHYSGVVAHEVAHAVIRHYIKDARYATVPQEFLAYATQLATLPKDRRDAIIREMGVGPWEGGDAIGNVYMAISPGKFAVKSYLYLMSLENPKTFVDLLLNTNWFYVYVPKAG